MRWSGHCTDSFDPSRILTLLKKLQPEQAAAIEKQEEELSRKD